MLTWFVNISFHTLYNNKPQMTSFKYMIWFENFPILIFFYNKTKQNYFILHSNKSKNIFNKQKNFLCFWYKHLSLFFSKLCNVSISDSIFKCYYSCVTSSKQADSKRVLQTQIVKIVFKWKREAKFTWKLLYFWP